MNPGFDICYIRYQSNWLQKNVLNCFLKHSIKGKMNSVHLHGGTYPLISCLKQSLMKVVMQTRNSLALKYFSIDNDTLKKIFECGKFLKSLQLDTCTFSNMGQFRLDYNKIYSLRTLSLRYSCESGSKFNV